MKTPFTISGPRLWTFTREALQAFMAAANVGQGRWLIQEGLNAACLEDLPEICPRAAQTWIHAITGGEHPEQYVPRLLSIRGRDVETGKERFYLLPVTRELLLIACQLAPGAAAPEEPGAPQ